ncbi:hypothetical protein ACGFYV_05395 [Streptomyces sp. NPDC048297]|uniref:hypothetical protein n=1 Tax=Streptomyces sp. NPDC048297 TaxID=3365531 RepID=UPI00371061E2
MARALDVLVERGLASEDRTDDSAPRYRAASPVLALGPLLESRRTALHRVESLVADLADLAERHRFARAHTTGAPIEVLTGAAAIRHRLLLMQSQAVREVCTMLPLRRVPAVLTFEENHDEVEHELSRRGVVMRSVIERDWLEQPETAHAMATYVAEGQHIVVADKVPVKLIVVDRRIALLPFDPEREGEPVALVVHRTGLLTALGSLFDEYFEKGWRLRDPGTGPSNGLGTGPGNGLGTGPGNGLGTGPGNGLGTGPGNGLGTGPGNGLGTGPGNGLGTGPGNGLGTGPGTGLGTGPGNGLGTGPGTGHGTGPGNGLGTGPGTGHGTGPGNGLGIEPGTELGADDSGEARLDPVDRQIVAFLHVGLTDAAIARQLGMGHRTVQRRLQALMTRVGAATRFQLGWHAARSGWLDEAPASHPESARS